MKSKAEINKWLWCSCYIKKKQKKALQKLWEENREALTDMIQNMEVKNEI